MRVFLIDQFIKTIVAHPCAWSGSEAPGRSRRRNSPDRLPRRYIRLHQRVETGGALLTRRNHKLRSETPREACWDKAGEESREGCMGSYCPNRDSSPTQSQPASRKSQQMACDFCGLKPPRFCINSFHHPECARLPFCAPRSTLCSSPTGIAPMASP